MLKCKINGKEMEVKEGSSVIEAFVEKGDEIAHYCWHPGLSVAGVCRMCMVEVEGNPKLQIACNTPVTEGMVVSNQSEKVEEAVKWALDFHLINHPLDCPICDQAGECGLQDQYMRFGKYDPEMSENKVKKRKVVDLGPKVVLDSERCILCSRCVRFTSEVSKTHELGIFNRGDRSEIGTFEDKPLDNNYSLNTVDICPVGALTSKEFRFQQRVWFLKEHATICQGCSTGCNINISYNKISAFRAKPRFNSDVNGHWMCDEGRDISFINREKRLLRAFHYDGKDKRDFAPGAAVKEIGQLVKKEKSESLALVLTGQYTLEETEALVKTFKEDFSTENIFHWENQGEEEFDGILLRGDRNPNTKGLMQVFDKYKIKTSWQDLEEGLSKKSFKTVVVAGPENQKHFSDIAEKLRLFSWAENLVWLTTNPVPGLKKGWQVPVKSFVEKSGHFINYNGIQQKIEAGPLIVSQALNLEEVALLLSGRELSLKTNQTFDRVQNEIEKTRGLI